MSFSCQVLANYLIKYLIAVSWWSNEGAARRCCSSPRAAVLGSAKKPSIHLPPPPPSPAPRCQANGAADAGGPCGCAGPAALYSPPYGAAHPPPRASREPPQVREGAGGGGGGRRAQRRAVGTRGAACVAMGVSRPEDPRPHALRCRAAPGPRESLFPPPGSGAGAAERLSGASGGGGSRAEPRLGKRPLGAGTVRG